VVVQIAWYRRGKVIETDTENGLISGVDQSSSADGTQLINAADDSDLSMDDELFGLLDKSGADRKVTNGNYPASESMSHGVHQYVGNMSSMLSGININHSTVVQ